jgi:translation initiation factor 3 subunit B
MPAMPDGGDAAPHLEDDFECKHHEMRSVAKDCLVVIDNLPEVPPEKYAKLCDKVFSYFMKAATVARDGESDTPRIVLARDDSGNTLGYAFVEYVSPEEAHKAVISLHNTPLSRKNIFWVDTAGALERLQDVPDIYTPPDLNIASRDRPDYKSWLLDQRGRDMFMIRHDTNTSIWWHDHVVRPQLVCLLVFFLLLTSLGRTLSSATTVLTLMDNSTVIVQCQHSLDGWAFSGTALSLVSALKNRTRGCV